MLTNLFRQEFDRQKATLLNLGRNTEIVNMDRDIFESEFLSFLTPYLHRCRKIY